MRLVLLLIFFFLISVLSIFFTGIALYAFGEFFFLFYKHIPVSFTMYNFLLIFKISIFIGGFVGVFMWAARLLKLKGF